MLFHNYHLHNLALNIWHTNKEAQYNLAMNYINGTNVIKKDLPEAIKWLELASKQNHIGAMYQLGMCYLNGLGVQKDPKKAFEYLEDSAMAGDRDAQYQLGLMYRDGNGLAADNALAYAWFKIASQGGGLDIIKIRDTTLKSLTPDELSRAQSNYEDLSQKLMQRQFNQFQIEQKK